MEDVLGAISHDILSLSSTEGLHHRFKAYLSPSKAADVDASMRMLTSMHPIIQYVETTEAIFSRCNHHVAPQDEERANEAAIALRCMCQFSAGLQYIFHELMARNEESDFAKLIDWFNQSITNHATLSDVDLITTLTRHTGLASEIRTLENLVQTAHQDLSRTKLDTRQRETIRSERSVHFHVVKKEKKNNNKRKQVIKSAPSNNTNTHGREWTPVTVMESSMTLQINPSSSIAQTHQAPVILQRGRRRRMEPGVKSMIRRALRSRIKKRSLPHKKSSPKSSEVCGTL